MNDDGSSMSESLARIRNSVADISEQFKADTIVRLDEIDGMIEIARSEGAQASHAVALFRELHVIQGQGSSFDYNLITSVGGMAAHYVRNREILSDEDLKLVSKTVQALRLILQQDLTGDGGATGEALRLRFRKMFSNDVQMPAPGKRV